MRVVEPRPPWPRRREALGRVPQPLALPSHQLAPEGSWVSFLNNHPRRGPCFPPFTALEDLDLVTVAERAVSLRG